MQDRDTLRNLLIAAAIFLFVFSLMPRLFPPPPARPIDPAAEPDERFPEEVQPADSGGDRLPGEEKPAPGEVGAEQFFVHEAETEETRVMGADPAVKPAASRSRGRIARPRQPRDDPFRTHLFLSNVGASIVSATLTDHAEDLVTMEPYRLLSPWVGADGRTWTSMAVEKISINEEELTLDDKKWHAGDVRDTEDGHELVFWIDVYKGDAAVLRLTRLYRLPRQPKKLRRRDLFANLTVENLSDEDYRVLVTYRGGVGISTVNARLQTDRVIDWGIFDGTRVNGSRETFQSIAKKSGGEQELFAPRPGAPNLRLAWAATGNTYFTATIAPLNRDGADNADYVAGLLAVNLDGSAETTDDVTVRVATKTEHISAGGRLTYPTDIYLGEKDAEAFHRHDVYKARNYYFQISKGFGWCTFNWLVELMIWLLNRLYAVTFDYGLAIIVLVLIVRLILHPITKKGQVNMVKMQQKMGEFQPKIEELKRKYANDKARMQQEMMKLYRDAGINPAANMMTCLPMLLQMPIWVALFFSLSNNIRMRHQPLHFTWIQDLTSPDALYTFSSPIIVPLFGWELPAFNLLPILLAIFMYLQQKLMPRPKPNPNMTEQQRQQQEMMLKMMPIMSIMMLIIFYKMPSGLNLYIMSSSFFGMIEQRFIRKHIRQREEAGTLLEPAPKVKPLADRKPKGRLSFFEKLQKMADEARKSQPRRTNKRKARR